MASKTNGVDKVYDFGQKNNWRRWQWNRIEEIVAASGSSKRESQGIGLFGKEGLDYPVAEKKGFSKHNLITVDSDMGAVKAARSLGRTAICGDILDVLLNWPVSNPLDFVVLDFCGFLTVNRLNTLVAATQAVRTGGAIAVNIMGARDSLGIRVCEHISKKTDPLSLFIQEKHRAKAAVDVLFTQPWATEPSKLSIWKYKSGRTPFHSAVFENPFDRFEGFERHLAHERNNGIKGKISAAIAIRTMRKNGKLGRSRES